MNECECSNWCPPQLSGVQLKAGHERLKLECRLAETEAEATAAREEVRERGEGGGREREGGRESFVCPGGVTEERPHG